MIYVSYYANKDVDTENNRYCSISVGTPRWKLPYEMVHAGFLKPYGIFNKYDNMEDYRREYRKKLESIGVDRIRKFLSQLQGDKKNIVLLCYEKNKYECHRWIFAEWWMEKTGEVVEEWHEQCYNQLIQ